MYQFSLAVQIQYKDDQNILFLFPPGTGALNFISVTDADDSLVFGYYGTTYHYFWCFSLYTGPTITEIRPSVVFPNDLLQFIGTNFVPQSM